MYPQHSLKTAIIWFVILNIFVISVGSTYGQSIYIESPMLTEQVTAGGLPKIDDRLPMNPRLVQPEREIGIYGGTWYFGMLKTGDGGSINRTIGYEGLLRWDPQWTHIIPNVAQSYTTSEDAHTFTFTLRKGMRWSDGEPFTVEDVIFWANATKQKGIRVTALDDVTVQIVFDEPNGLFPQFMATLDGRHPVRYPKHYLAQFHADYSPDAEALAEAAGFEKWEQYFANRADYLANPELPTLNAWLLTSAYPTEADTIEAVRNPYYWKIDTDFQQLPYIDRVVFRQFNTTEEITQWAVSGELGAQDRYVGVRNMRDFYEAQADKVGFGFYNLQPAFSNSIMIALNYNAPEPIMADLIAKLPFRAGLSHAINRQRIIDDIFDGIGTPYQIAPRPESPFYNERLARQYLEYDVTLANQYLDESGITARDAEGYRLRSDGARVVIPFTVPDINTDYPLILEHIREDWAAVGIEVTVTLVKREALGVNGSKHIGVVWDSDGGSDVILESRYYVPYGGGANYYAPRWVHWFTNPADEFATEPPQVVKDQVALYEKINTSVDPEVQAEYMHQVLEIAADQFYVMGISLAEPTFGLVANNFHNVPSVMPLAFRYPTPAPSNPEQYFITPPAN